MKARGKKHFLFFFTHHAHHKFRSFVSFVCHLNIGVKEKTSLEFLLFSFLRLSPSKVLSNVQFQTSDLPNVVAPFKLQKYLS